MKKITPYLFAIAASGITILLAGTVSVLLVPGNGHGQKVVAPSPQAAEQMAQGVMQAKCAACHGAGASYNSFINFLAFGQLRRDVENAQKAFTMTGANDIRSGVVEYLKMDKVLRTRSMPPTQYTLVHLGTCLTPADIAVLRTRYTQQGATARMFAPIQPGNNERDTKGATPISRAMQEGIRALGENPLKVRLGHLLFFDPRLSTTNGVSCASCHDLTLGGTDNKTKSEGVPGGDGTPQLGGVNAPSVYNAAGNIRQFWDGRAANLAEQAGGPPLNPVEMGYAKPEDWALIAGKLAEDPELAALFSAVYGDAGITGDTITDAIAAFEKCLSTPDSDFDRFLRGDEHALTEKQKQGLNDYISYGCVTCHAGSTLGGASFENINTHADLRAHAGEYEESAFGLADFTKDAKHKDMFRVPNLRNVALTAPYFHTGTAATLEEAVRIMFQTEAGLEPSKAMVQRVTDFLHAQTGKLGGKPLDMLTQEDVAPTTSACKLRPAPKCPPPMQADTPGSACVPAQHCTPAAPCCPATAAPAPIPTTPAE